MVYSVSHPSQLQADLSEESWSKEPPSHAEQLQEPANNLQPRCSYVPFPNHEALLMLLHQLLIFIFIHLFVCSFKIFGLVNENEEKRGFRQIKTGK